MNIAYVSIVINRDLGNGKAYLNDQLLGVVESTTINEIVKIEIPVSSVHRPILPEYWRKSNGRR